MIYLFLLLQVSLVFSGVTRTLDLSRLNPRPETIDGVLFPRMSEIKYRGASEVQMNREKALKAMLGEYVPMESILYSAVKLMLMKERVPFYAAVKAGIESRGLNLKVEQELQKNKNRPLTLENAHAAAFRLLEEDLMSKLKSGYFIDHYVDYRSPHYELFPQDMIFSTVHLEVANIYSKNITVIEDKPGHMLDLNFWNRSRNGAWVFTQRKWVDKGEFISPILIEPEKIVGFMEYLTQVPDYRIFRPLPNELDLAFMKHQNGPEVQILVFDGSGNQDKAPAIVKNKDLYHQADSQFAPEADIPEMLKERKGPSFLLGIIKLCPVKDTCRLTSSLFSSYRRSKRQLPKEALDELKEIKIDGAVPKIFYKEGSITAKELSTAPYTVEYPSSENIIESDIKSVSYKLRAQLGGPDSIKGSTLAWKFSGTKLGKDEVIYLSIPDSYRSKKIKKMTLLQRQDERDNSTPLRGNFDKSPSYTSVQFYALTESTEDPWRYWGGHFRFGNPKGSLFADIADESKMKEQVLEDWSNTKGHNKDQVLAEDISAGALRIIGAGTDPATLYGLSVEFK